MLLKLWATAPAIFSYCLYALSLQQEFVCSFALGNVFTDTRQANDILESITQEYSGVPADASQLFVLCQKISFSALLNSVTDVRFVPLSPLVLIVYRHEDIEPIAPEDLFSLPACYSQQKVIAKHDVPMNVQGKWPQAERFQGFHESVVRIR